MSEGRFAASLAKGVASIGVEVLDAFIGLRGGPFAIVIDGVAELATGERILDRRQRKSVDERLSRLDVARSALEESLGALDELKADAEQSRAEYERTRVALEAALASKQDAEHQLAEVRAIMSGEVSAFQRVAGVSDVRKERVIGFFNGILSSAACGLLVWGGTLLLKHFNIIA